MRKNNGSILLLSTSFLLVLVLLGIGFFFLCMTFGGARQSRDAVEAGTLAAIKDAMEHPSLNLNERDDPYNLFEPVTKGNRGVTLQNFNRIAAIGMLVELNESAMEDEGTSTGWKLDGSARNAQTVADLVKEKAEIFSEKFHAANAAGTAIRKASFSSMASANSINLLGVSSKAIDTAPLGWDPPAYMNRRTATNVYLEARQIPQNIQQKVRFPFKNDIPSTRIRMRSPGVGTIEHYYLTGYEPYRTFVDDRVRRPRESSFVPLRPPLPVHLVDEGVYKKDRLPPPAVSRKYSIPNAFSAHARVTDQHGSRFEYKAFAVAEAMDEGYPVCIPNGFVRIENKTSDRIDLKDLLARNPSMSQLRERIYQRLWEVNPSASERELAKQLDIELEPARVFGDTAIISQFGARRPYLQIKTIAPDGNDSLRPYVQDKYILQWIPSSGHNNLLGVLQIKTV